MHVKYILLVLLDLVTFSDRLLSFDSYLQIDHPAAECTTFGVTVTIRQCRVGFTVGRERNAAQEGRQA